MCYFDDDGVVIVWTHEKLGQPTHLDTLGMARLDGSEPRGAVRLVELLGPPDRPLPGVGPLGRSVRSSPIDCHRTFNPVL